MGPLGPGPSPQASSLQGRAVERLLPVGFSKRASVCQRGECGTLSLKLKSPKTNQVTSRFLLPILPAPRAVTSPALPSCLCVKNILWKFETL